MTSRKTAYTLILTFIACLFLLSCKKYNIANTPPETAIVNHWSINRIQAKTYYNGALLQDTVIQQYPMPENFVQFNADHTLQYRFNKQTTDNGTYQFVGTDSLYTTIGTTQYKWKIIMLTIQIVNIKTTTPLPGVTGGTVETYQTYVR